MEERRITTCLYLDTLRCKQFMYGSHAVHPSFSATVHVKRDPGAGQVGLGRVSYDRFRQVGHHLIELDVRETQASLVGGGAVWIELQRPRQQLLRGSIPLKSIERRPLGGGRSATGGGRSATALQP